MYWCSVFKFPPKKKQNQKPNPYNFLKLNERQNSNNDKINSPVPKKFVRNIHRFINTICNIHDKSILYYSITRWAVRYSLPPINAPFIINTSLSEHLHRSFRFFRFYFTSSDTFLPPSYSVTDQCPSFVLVALPSDLFIYTRLTFHRHG